MLPILDPRIFVIGIICLSALKSSANIDPGEGLVEEHTRGCHSQPCQNGATCIDSSLSGYHCICPPGFYANDCSLTYNPCANHVCHNGGICQIRDRTYTAYCECVARTYGTSCEFTECLESNNHCRHDGVCRTHVPNNLHVCLCRGGYFGESCQCSYETCDLVPCPSNHCSNSGTCYLDGGHPICRCRAQYYGPRCGVRF
ncbi:delta-like protein 4 [Ptychodera flava]|uniref:delta-like protein 4 n=1 Tax=Ptychodera flava TaxID=63121 RepID=UPI00396A8AD6